MKKLLKYLALLAACLMIWQCVPKVDPDNPDDPSEQKEPEPKPEPEPEPQPEPEPEPEGPKSTECVLNTLKFSSAFNPTLGESLSVEPKNIWGIDMILITFPEGADLSGMIASFSISENAKLIVAGQEVDNGRTPLDLTLGEPWTVVAEDGKHSTTYLFLARTGDTTIDRKIYSFMGNYDIPAVGLAVTKGEKLTYVAGYGLAVADDLEPEYCTADHLFRLASVSKTLTSICILSLCQEGKLSLDDKVFSKDGALGNLFPGFHQLHVNDITVADLMTHRSGWVYSCTGGVDPVFTDDYRFAGKNLKQRVEYMVKYVQPAYTPGTYYSYYNLGFCILGLVIEQVSGKSYEEYLREVMSKAGANDIWVSKTPRSQRRYNECIFYSQESANPYGNDMDIAAACGGVTASASDMARILTAIDYGTVVPDILAPDWLNQMYMNHTSYGIGGYGFGWWIGRGSYSNWAAYHTGTLAGTATLWVKGNNGVNGVILCNSRSYKSSFDNDMFNALDKAMTRVMEKY